MILVGSELVLVVFILILEFEDVFFYPFNFFKDKLLLKPERLHKLKDNKAKNLRHAFCHKASVIYKCYS